MFFDIYGILKDAFELFIKGKKHVSKRISFIKAFKYALKECKENENISQEFCSLLESSKKPTISEQIKNVINKSNGARELEEDLRQIFLNTNIQVNKQEVTCFISSLFYYLLQSEEYSQKIINMRTDIEVSETHQMLKKHLSRSANSSKPISVPRILTRYAPRAQEELVGRENDLTNILSMLNDKNKIVIVNGMGGIGKTALCRALFHNKKITKQLAWINYKGNLLDDLVEQFYYPIFDNDTSYNERLDRILIFLREEIKETAFLFIDNVNATIAEDQNLQVLDSFRCKIICTSRIRGLGLFDIYDLDFLNEYECIKMFEQYYRVLDSEEEKQAIKEVVRLAGFHTLTIEAIAKVSLEDGLFPLDILDKLKSDGFNLSEAVAQITHRDQMVRETTIINHLKYVFDITNLNENELTVLKCLAIFPNMSVPTDAYKWFELPNLRLFNHLTKYAWLKKTDNGFFMHHVIKEVIKCSCEITIEDIKKVIFYFIKELESDESKSIKHYNSLLPFAEYVLNHFNDSQNIEIGLLCCSIGQAYYYVGKYSEAMSILNKALQILSIDYTDNDKKIFSIYCVQAAIQNKVGEFETSAYLYKKAIIGCESSDHTNTTIMADIYRDAATNYIDLNDYSLSIKYGKMAIKIYEEKSEILDLASAYNNLGLTYYYVNKHDDALHCYFKAKKLYENNIPDDHQDFATLYNNIALIMCDKGEFDQALEYHLRALNIRNKFENENHIDLSETYNNIATVFGRKGIYEKAIEYQILDISILQKINKNHPYLKQSYQKMQEYYEAIGDMEKSNFYREKSNMIEI